MNENTFIQKFRKKTDSELEYIIENKQNYNEQAVSASIQILKDRNGQSIELENIEKEIVAEKEKEEAYTKQLLEEKEEEKSNLTDDPNAPEMHSAIVIRAFSIIFSTVFGAVLLAYNLKQINNAKGRNQVLIFGVLYTIASIVLINLLNIKFNLALVFNIGGATILTEYFEKKFIDKDLIHRKRSWIKPAIISVLITIPFVLAIIYGV